MITEGLEAIFVKYWHEDDDCYSGYFYNENKKEFRMKEEVESFLENSGCQYLVELVDGFDSCGYACDVLSIAWIENGQLFLNNILLEYK